MVRLPAVAVLLAFLVVPWPPAFAQGTSVTITGIVRDVSGRPLPGAAVVLDPESNFVATRTGADGRFRIERIPRGQHRLRVSWIGYRPDDRDLDLREGAVSIEVVLEPLAYLLDTMSVIARRGGIVGRVFGQISRAPVNGASIEVLGSRWRKRTGADGQFELPELAEGSYAVQVRGNGYKARTITVVVPPSGAVEIAAALDSIMTDRDKRFENRLRDMEDRMHRRSRNTFAIIPRQELTTRPDILLDEAIRYAPSAIGKGFILMSPYVCRIYIDGVQDPVIRLKDIRADQIGMVEVHNASGCADELPGRRGAWMMRPGGKPGYFVYIWLKR